MTRATLVEIGGAVDAVCAYLEASPGMRMSEAVDVICDYQRIHDDRDRRIVRNAAERRQARYTRETLRRGFG